MKRTLAIVLVFTMMLTMTACSSGAGTAAEPIETQETAESTFMASAEEESADDQDAQAETPVETPAEKEEPFSVPEIDVMDLGTSFWFNCNEEGITITYDGSGNEYLVAKFNQAEDPKQAFHDIFGYTYIYFNGNERSYRDFYYTTQSEIYGNAIRYVNLDERLDAYVCPGWLHESIALGPFEGMLLAQIEAGDGDGSLKPGIYMFDTNGVMQEFFGDSYDPAYIQTGKYTEEEPPAPQPEPEKPAEPEPQPQAGVSTEPETEEENPIVVSEDDVLTVDTLYESDLSGNGETELFYLTADEDEGVFLLINGEIRQLSNIDPYLISNEYRIVDLNPAAKGKDLEILEAAPPYEQNIHFVQVSSDYSGEKVQAVGPLTVPYDAYENDRILYQGNNQIMVIEMSNIITAFYQKFYQVERGTIADKSRPDITKYMTPFRTTMIKGIWAFPTDHYTDSGNVYLNPGDEIIIHGESEGNLWIEVLGECSSEFMWLLGNMIDHYPDANGQYLFTGVQFWS